MHTIDTTEVLKEKFGLDKLRSKQSIVIENVLSGKHTLAVLPTGYGKSLCYQLPSQIVEGLTLVISPLISLMQDQIASLKKRGIENATFINSSLFLGLCTLSSFFILIILFSAYVYALLYENALYI